MRKSVTLIEIIVSAIILSVAFALLLSAFMFTRRYTARANRRLIANNWIRSASNYLYKEMARGDVDAPAFGEGQHGLPLNDTDYPEELRSEIEVDGITYSGFYTIVEDGDNRNITFNVTYDSIEF
ncbi:MAG: type II secretion system protein [Candidatus Omnitrophota bacterium]|nr:MAG: type II secretion system protein [Candidatus Omnitrophota bacterium]